jgi:alpha-glucosidase (family GH31 glycosyl hydrolase)
LLPLSYAYPNMRYENIKDQFMMGDDIMVAPVVTESDERAIVLPPGDWFYQNKKWKGGKTYQVKVAINELPVFIKKAKKS